MRKRIQTDTNTCTKPLRTRLFHFTEEEEIQIIDAKKEIGRVHEEIRKRPETAND